MLDRKLSNLLVTGGSGFIGSNFIRLLFKKNDFTGKIINYDKLTYAGNTENLQDIDKQYGNNRYYFVLGDITNYQLLEETLQKYDIDTIIHFAAESHVDRSIEEPSDFIETNVKGTFTLLKAAKNFWQERKDVLFHHISTDEVYGSLDETGYFYETSPYNPRSPYSASKAASDHLVKAYFHTYNLQITLSNCSNNYGPYQFPEKLIPLMILNIRDRKFLPVYGNGKNIRDWIYVDDHNDAIWQILKNGKAGETYNIGGDNEWENIHLVETLCEIMGRKLNQNTDEIKKLITFVKDRPGHDRRYAINCDKIKNDLGWKQKYDFKSGLEATIDWYLSNDNWIENIQSGEYQKWVEKNYGTR